MSSAADPEPGTVVEDADPPGIIARPARCDCAAAAIASLVETTECRTRDWRADVLSGRSGTGTGRRGRRPSRDYCPIDTV